jgi:hypothetical protein
MTFSNFMVSGKFFSAQQTQSVNDRSRIVNDRSHFNLILGRRICLLF